MTGYLTKADPDEEGETVDLTIPNDEISNIFEEAVMRFLRIPWIALYRKN